MVKPLDKVPVMILYRYQNSSIPKILILRDATVLISIRLTVILPTLAKLLTFYLVIVATLAVRVDKNEGDIFDSSTCHNDQNIVS